MVTAAVMGLHKLTAGDGYMYLIRQVAASDATERGRAQPHRLLQRQRRSPGHLDGPRPSRAGLTGLP